VIGGGEPSLHEDLPGAIRDLRASGAREVEVRTNGLRMAYASYARELAEAGLTRASVLVPSHDPAVSDRLTRRPDGHALALRGIENLIDCGVEVVVRIPLLRPTAASLSDTIDWISRNVPDASAIDLVHAYAGGKRLQLSFDEIADVLRDVLDRAAALGCSVRLDTAGGAPLCAIDRLPGFVPTGDELRGPRCFPPPCSGCLVRAQCRGLPVGHVDAFGHDGARPFRQTSTHVSSGEDAGEGDLLENVSTTIRYTMGAVGEKVDSVSLRITRRCNQDCSFCFIPWEKRTIDENGVEPLIHEAVEAGASRIVLTGGEPTLHPDLPRFIKAARDAGAQWVELQTNGILLSDRRTCERLVDAGLSSVAVSLPSHLPSLMDSIAAVPGNLPRVLQALGHLSTMDLILSVTHVVCTPNHREVGSFVRFLHERFRVHVFSILLAAPMSAPLARKDVIVRYSDAAPHIAEALDFCLEAGVHFEGLWERCGMPLCVLRTNPRYHQGAAFIPDSNRGAEFIDGPACGSCARSSSCYRIRGLYAYLYGTDEFHPFGGDVP
ncbi:MAG: radical SAM protein, partial [Deltaproteobacteria bacterium]|nr:radical SAM protein [Deltaproteobacteria bacterium]